MVQGSNSSAHPDVSNPPASSYVFIRAGGAIGLKAPPTIVEGMLNKKFFGANVLLDQEWVHDSSKTVAQALKEAGAEVVDFQRFSVAR